MGGGEHHRGWYLIVLRPHYSPHLFFPIISSMPMNIYIPKKVSLVSCKHGPTASERP
jgi:hypothetical protein